jgi:FkbM family methyltransferase
MDSAQLAERFPLSDLSSQPTLEPVVEVETAVGPLLLPRADQIITQILLQGRFWEAPETRYLRSILGRGQAFVDVGAHVGYFSVLAAKRVGPSGTVIAVEPEARNLDLLHRNLARNGCSNAVVLPFAAHSVNGQMSLALEEENRGAHHLVPLGEAVTRVDCVRLDDVLPTTVDVVKIDAQGYDHEIVAGLERTLAANPRMIVIAELSHGELDRRGVDVASVLAGYEALGLTISIFDGRGRVRRVTAEDVLMQKSRPDFSLILERPAAPAFSALGPRARPRIADRLEVNEVSDGLIVFQSSRNRVHQLNQTAGLVLDLCTGERTVAEIASVLQQTYELPHAPTDEVVRCLERLGSEGLVT